MEQRREPRFSVDTPVRVRVLGDAPWSTEGRVVNASGRGLRLIVDRRVAPGAAVQVELSDGSLLCEVCYSAPEGAGFAIGLQLDQMLAGLSELARHVDQLLQKVPEHAERL